MTQSFNDFRTFLRRFFISSLFCVMTTTTNLSFALEDNSRKSTATSTSFYFPPSNADSWEQIEPQQIGWNIKQLEAARDYAFAERSKGLLLLLNGRILFEAYKRPWHKDKSTRIFSVTKSMTAVLIAMAQQQHKLNLNDPVHNYLGIGWSKATPQQESKITLWHLLSMSSGLTKKLTYQHPPGEVWFYNNEAYYLLFEILEKATGLSRTEFTSQFLFEPLGMKNSKYPFGNRSVRVSASTRDMGRFGLLMLNQGSWPGKTLLSNQQLIKEMLSPTQQDNPSYGLLWWLNGGNSFRLPGSDIQFTGNLLPHIPKDAFLALGHGSKIILVIPSMDLVMVRHGKPAKSKDFMRVLTEKIIRAAPTND